MGRPHWILGSHSSGCEEFCLLGYDTIYLLYCVGKRFRLPAACLLLASFFFPEDGSDLCCASAIFIDFHWTTQYCVLKTEMFVMITEHNAMKSVVICSFHFQGRCLCITINSAAQKARLQILVSVYTVLEEPITIIFCMQGCLQFLYLNSFFHP
jgi:hypothetical protein